MKRFTFNLDFDFTCIIPDGKGEFVDNPGAERVLKRIVANNHDLILFTARSNKPYKLTNGETDYNGLDKAVDWFKEREIPLYGIQINPTQHIFTESLKSFADYMIDDTCIFANLIYDKNLSERGFINWNDVERVLENKGII